MKKSSGRCENCGRSESEHPVHLHGTGFGDCKGHSRPPVFVYSNLYVPEFNCPVFVKGANGEKEEGDPVTCFMCGGRAEIAFRDVGDEVKVECPKCGLYDAYMANLTENEEDEDEE